MARDHRSDYQKRNDAARALGYSGYSERRRARQTGRGLRGPDINDPKVVGNRRVITLGGGGSIVQLTANNRGEGSVRSRVESGDTVTVTWTANGVSGPIPMSRTVLWDDVDEFDSIADWAADETGRQYSGGTWLGAVGEIQVKTR